MSLALVGIIGIVVLLLILFFLGMPVGFAMALVVQAGEVELGICIALLSSQPEPAFSLRKVLSYAQPQVVF